MDLTEYHLSEARGNNPPSGTLLRIVRFALLFASALALLLNSCKKSETGPNGIPFESAFIGVWYSDSIAVGFEVKSDGTSKTLVVDSAGTLQYATASSGTPGAISLTLLSGMNGNFTANVRYHVLGFIDTTVSIPGTYSFSNNNNTLNITFPNPAAGGQIQTIAFLRTSIGAVVRPRIASTYPLGL